nr:OmpA family protein [Thioalkalivibrio halophilus]
MRRESRPGLPRVAGRLAAWLTGAALVLLAAPAPGGTLYQETLERSDWTRVEIDDLCRLEQRVRHGGSLQFETRPGLAVRAFWDPPYPVPGRSQAPLETGAPEWLPGDGPAPLSLMLRAGPDDRYRVPDDRVQALKARLLAGHDVRIGFPDGEDIVHFRGIRFGRRVEGFRICQAEQGMAEGAPEAGDGTARERWVVYFDSGRTALDGEARATLDRVVAALDGVEGPRLRVIGLTDAEGPDRVNRRISQQRAETVRDALGEAGLGTADIEIEAGGVAPGVEDESRDARRAEIWWVGERGSSGSGPQGEDPAPEAARDADPAGDDPAAPQPVEPGGGTAW